MSNMKTTNLTETGEARQKVFMYYTRGRKKINRRLKKYRGKDGKRMRSREKEEKEKQIISCRLSHFWRRKKDGEFFHSDWSDRTSAKIQHHYILLLICCTHKHTQHHTELRLTGNGFEWEEYLLPSLEETLCLYQNIKRRVWVEEKADKWRPSAVLCLLTDDWRSQTSAVTSWQHYYM